MKSEKINMSDNEAKKISNMLQKQGLSLDEINVILNGDYLVDDSKNDMSNLFGTNSNYQEILRALADGYTIEEVQNMGVKQSEIQNFMKELDKYDLSIENAKAINQYSSDSNMILSMKRGLADKSKIQNEVKSDMMTKLKIRGLNQEQILNIENYIEKLDFNKPVHENYDSIKQYMQELNVPSKCYASACLAVKDMDSLKHIDSTLSSLDEGLSKSKLPESMKLYRAIKTNGETNLKDYIGKNISNDGYTSTSPIYDSSFAKYDDYDTVMELYAPKGTQGSYIDQLSDYDGVEHEILLNSNDIYVVDVQSGVIDKNGKSKTVLKGLLLSKDRECYKGIDKNQELKKDLNVEKQSNNDTIGKVSSVESLQERQNKLLHYFNKMKSKITRKNYNLNDKKSENNIKTENRFIDDLKNGVNSQEKIVESENSRGNQQPEQAIEQPTQYEL